MRTVLFDATRLFIRGSRFSPTGIDRVVLAYARWLIGRSDINLQPVVTAGGQLWRMPRALLAQIVENTEIFRVAARAETAVNESWSALVAALQSDATLAAPLLRSKSIIQQLPARVHWHVSLLGRSMWRLRPAETVANSLYVNVSHTGLGNPYVLPRLAAKGMRCVVMVHDLIPIEYPEYCAPGANARHVRRMDSILGNTALVIANSKTTADSLAAYAHRVGRPCPPMKVALLGVEPDFISPPPPLNVSRQYFVCVGTLEARKNLAFLLALWRRVAGQMDARAPQLILIGRRGWENESVIDHLERSETVMRLVHEVSDLQDAELAKLVCGATALLAPSFAEGFDLPVIEALSLRTPVIASDIAVHRELASSAMLIDPLDGPGWLNTIINAKSVRGPEFRAPRWDDHFAALEDTILGSG
jgi:glycosyltransferase involved in cell wall biosynthesis